MKTKTPHSPTLYPNLVETVVQNVETIFTSTKYADKVIERSLKSNSKWGARDRAFIASYTYDMVRWWRLLAFTCGIEHPQTVAQLYQLFAALWVWKGNTLPNWKNFDGWNQLEWEQRLAEAKLERKIRESIPDWLDELGMTEMPEYWDVELAALNQTAPFVLRVNTLKTTREKVLAMMKQDGIDAAVLTDTPNAIQLQKRMNLFNTPYIQNGLVEVQDAASQWVAAYLDVQPGMRVIDACAGAGGKSLHLAALMQNRGRLISMDVEQYKLDELKKRARRAGVGNIETKLIESGKTIKRLHESADRVLLDVPCSGLGVLRRNPDAKWKLEPAFIERIRNTQREILDTYTGMVKPGGYCVYATCSILPSEDEQQVEWFLKQHPTFRLVKQQRISVAQTGHDGFYMALLHKAH
ncbi:MAG: RsmB/NOP family class I SAM-dependent RNA methyltransferase [Bacteroidia bacterium]|nr:RsmB/NOP family class I SAM-dependent RNA methyltransferase [Bacteroidia bacterium]